MKRLVVLVSILFLSIPSISFASSPTTLTAPSHRHLDGTFVDDTLATELLPTGRYGTLVFNNLPAANIWRIDPAFIEDVQAMTKPYVVSGLGAGKGQIAAQAWLGQLKKNISGKRVEAIVYGNPTEYWVTKFFPHDREFLLTVSGLRLHDLLKIPVIAPVQYDSRNYFSLSSPQVRLLTISAARVAASAAYVDSTTLENYKLSQVKMLNAGLTSTARQSLAYDLAGLVNSLRNSVRVSTGKFTITSTDQKLPVTVTNDFPQPITVNLNINSTNEKILVGDISKVTVPGKSKIQIMIPVKVFTSGDSGFTITLTGKSGNVFGQTVSYPLKIAVISPIATWITGAAGIVLLSAAILQSMRRVRRGRKRDE
jgi:hypothetical protein